MNLAVHGLEGEIKHGNAYDKDHHHAVGRFDYLLANPPFNVSQVDKERLAAEVGPSRRFPFGLPRHRAAAPGSSWPTPPPTPAAQSKRIRRQLIGSIALVQSKA